MKKSFFYWNWLASIAKLSHTQRNGTMESTTSKSPIKEKAVIAAFLAVVTALTSLPNDAEAAAPPPTYELYGTDTKRTYRVVNLGIVPIMPIYRFGAWERAKVEINRVYKPGSRGREESVATSRYYWDEGTRETYGVILTAKSTKWFVADNQKPEYDNLYHYRTEKDPVTGKRSRYDFVRRGDKDPAVIDLGSKAWLVGSRTWYTGLGWRGNVNSGTQKHVGRWRTSMKLTAQHTSGGAKRFTVNIDYGVNGSTDPTTISRSVTLSPGETTTISLFSPGGDWSNILDVSIRENAPPAPIPTPGNGGRSGDGDGPSLEIGIGIGPTGPEIGVGIEIPITPNAQSTNQAQRPSGNGN